MPGLFAGGTIVFIFAFTELGVPLIFDYSRVTSVQIFYGIKEIAGNPFPFALVVVMLVSTLLLYLLSKTVFGGKGHAMMAKATTASGARPVGALGGVLCIAAFGGVTLLALLPHAGVVLVSFAGDWYRTMLPGQWTAEHYETALGHELTVPSIINSLKYASVSTLVDLLLGVAIAYVVVRTTLPGRGLLDAVAMLPLAVPGLVLAFGYVSMTQDGRVFAFFNPSQGSHAVAHHRLCRAAAALRRAFRRRGPAANQRHARGSRAESRLFTVAHAAPNHAPAHHRQCPRRRIARLLVRDARSLRLADPRAEAAVDYPITKAIYELFQLLGEGRFVASALGVWAMVFLGLTIFATSRILGKKMGALFRV